ncbi:preprotein translocase subunit SecE [Candidatus Peregrinibacteria bacterium]|nr:MAG: preprotein translocase subunit SecE [Candidatus Peregrinibacteria bacterium]
MKQLKSYFKNSLQELHSVTWPTRNQAIRLSIIVLVFVVISAAVLGLVDGLLAKGYQWLISL